MSDHPQGNQWKGTDVQNLIRHCSSGRYYGRFSIGGKRKYVNLHTDKKTVAKLKLLEESAKIEKSRALRGGVLKMRDLFVLYRQRVVADSTLSEATRLAREDHLKRIEKTWPELEALAPVEVTLDMICDWNTRARNAAYVVENGRKPKRYSPASVIKSVECLQRLFRLALEKEAILKNPFDSEHSEKEKLRATARKKKLWLPESKLVEQMFHAVENPPLKETPQLTGMNRKLRQDAVYVGELVRFMAYSGARLGEANAATWEDVRPDGMFLRGTKSEDSQDRLVPWNPALKDLIEKIRARRTKHAGSILLAREAEKSLTRACKEMGIPRFTHHTLRHYFATVVIESGVDIPVLAEWLGHGDGGVLAMRTYGHLRRAHSVASAQRLKFGHSAPLSPEKTEPSACAVPAPADLASPSATGSSDTRSPAYAVW